MDKARLLSKVWLNYIYWICMTFRVLLAMIVLLCNFLQFLKLLLFLHLFTDCVPYSGKILKILYRLCSSCLVGFVDCLLVTSSTTASRYLPNFWINLPLPPSLADISVENANIFLWACKRLIHKTAFEKYINFY